MARAYTISICHELRNPLMILGGQINLLKRENKAFSLKKLEDSFLSATDTIRKFESIDPQNITFARYSSNEVMINMPNEKNEAEINNK